jgi:hypothetical protein
MNMATLEKKHSEWWTMVQDIEKEMEFVMKHCIKILESRGYKSYIEEYTEDEFIWHGGVYCAVEFRDFTVTITLSDMYDDAAIDYYAERHDMDYGDVDLQDPDVDDEITVIAQEHYIDDAKGLKEEFKDMIRYLKRSKFVAAIYMQPCVEIGSVDETIYEKRPGSKKHIDETLAKKSKLAKLASQYSKAKSSQFITNLVNDALKGVMKRKR